MLVTYATYVRGIDLTDPFRDAHVLMILRIADSRDASRAFGYVQDVE